MDSRMYRITLIFGVIACLLRLSHSSGSVCLATWTKHDHRLSIGGTPRNINDLGSCLAFCRFSSDCVAIDFDTSETSATTPCWTHTDPNDLTDDNIYFGSQTTQYVVNRDCASENVSGVAECQLSWQRLPGIHSIDAFESTNHWTEFDCFTYCRLKADCVAADFDIAVDPPCWIHNSYDDLTSDNTFDDSNTVVQYRMNRTCPASVSSSFQLGQCAGYVMKSGAWCSNGEEIHIVKASYKNHPLCCYGPGNGDLVDVPDSTSLPELDVFQQSDDNYKSDIRACEGTSACNVTAKTYQSSFISNGFCPTRSDRTDYVSITYTCLPKGHSDPSTSTHASSEIPVVHSSLATHLISSSSASTGSSLASPMTNANLSSQSSNRDALILAGFGVALGGLALIILIVIGVCWYLRYERYGGQTGTNPMYYNNNNGSVISDGSVDPGRYNRQLKGVSTAIIYPEVDVLSA